MNLLFGVLPASAADGGVAASGQGGFLGILPPIVLMIVFFYFLVFRPQKKKQQEHDKMISSITRGDIVISAGGFFGRVRDVLDDSYIVEIADGVKVRVLKGSISSRRDASDPKAKLNRPKKKRRSASRTNGTNNDAKAEGKQSQTNGVTVEENTVLMDEQAKPDENQTAATPAAGEAENDEKQENEEKMSAD
jgi:preprotein translocase subunit YajC